MKKLTTIVDKSWLQRICKRRDIAEGTFDSLKQKWQPVVALVLIEEILANRFQPTRTRNGEVLAPPEVQAIISRMIQAILDFHPHWMEHPAELVFKELVKNDRIADAGLSQDGAKRTSEALSNPDKASPDLGKWMTNRNEEKKQRSVARKRQQEAFRTIAPKAFLRPPDLATFAKNGSSFLAMVLDKPGWKHIVLESYLGQTWKRWHSTETAEIDSALRRLD